MSFFRRRARGEAVSTVAFVFDDEDARRLYRGETTHRVRWADLDRVAIRTTDDGPFAEDVFWVLLGTHENGFVVPANLAPDGFLERLQQLPGFDSAAVIEAMQSIEENVFVCWRKQP